MIRHEFTTDYESIASQYNPIEVNLVNLNELYQQKVIATISL